MKKTCAFLTLFLIIFSLTAVLAADNETDAQKIQKAFECLEDKADDCFALTTQEIALTILATPDNIFNDCVNELIDRKSSDHWGNIRDTALAILALKHAGQNTTSSEEWLLLQTKTPTDLVWYLQEDSNEETECHIGYDAKDFTINIGTDKKIDSDAGSCLTRAQTNFWLQINNNCYDETFQIECNKDFIANLIYRNKNSPTIYVLEGTQSAPSFDSIELTMKSKCFGESSCDYEDTAWATIALMKTNHNVEEFIPYIIAMSETNERYLPKAFVYALTNYEDYATELIESQKLGNYWEAKLSAYNRYYDTSLALLVLGGSTAEQVSKAKAWMFFSQGSNGCWKNSITETAIALWAIEGRAGRIATNGTNVTVITTIINGTNITTITNGTTITTIINGTNITTTNITNITNGTGGTGGTGSSTPYCTQSNYFCIPSTECPSSQDIGNNYFCPSLSSTCCMTENLQTCSELGGKQCQSSEVCTGNSRKTSDTNTCCTGSCKERPEENECESNFYTCMDTCSEFQESVSTYACNQNQVCCKTKTTTTSEGTPWWIWVLVILIIAVLAAIGYVYREQLKLYWFQLKTKFKKDKDDNSTFPRGPGSRFPPRPGFPPVRRSMPPVAPPRRFNQRTDTAMSDTFRKLNEMSK